MKERLILVNEKLLGRVIDTSFYLFKANKEPEYFVESFRPAQITCKKWLVDEVLNFSMNWKKVLVLGSWNGILLYELFKVYGKVEWYDFVDINPIAHKHRDIYFEQHKFNKNYNSITMRAEDYSDLSGYDLVINTSCEHMPDIPAEFGPMYALQSNNYFSIKEHINCVESWEELKKKNNMKRVHYHGEKEFKNYKRFMVIGYSDHV